MCVCVCVCVCVYEREWQEGDQINVESDIMLRVRKELQVCTSTGSNVRALRDIDYISVCLLAYFLCVYVHLCVSQINI